MDRRSLLIGGGAGLISAPVLGPVSALANPNERDEEGNPIHEFDRVRLFIPSFTKALLIVALIIITSDHMYGWSLKNPVKKLPLNRANTSKIPLLGNLTRGTVEQRVQAMDFLGTILLVNTAMVLVLTAGLPRPKKAAIVNRDSEFVIDKRARPLKAESLRANAMAGGDAKIGTFWYDRKSEEVVAIVPPTRPNIRLPGS